MQEIKAAPGSKLRQYIDEINNLYPADIIQYYSPDYAATLMKKLDDYNQGEWSISFFFLKLKNLFLFNNC